MWRQQASGVTRRRPEATSEDAIEVDVFPLLADDNRFNIAASRATPKEEFECEYFQKITSGQQRGYRPGFATHRPKSRPSSMQVYEDRVLAAKGGKTVDVTSKFYRGVTEADVMTTPDATKREDYVIPPLSTIAARDAGLQKAAMRPGRLTSRSPQRRKQNAAVYIDFSTVDDVTDAVNSDHAPADVAFVDISELEKSRDALTARQTAQDADYTAQYVADQANDTYEGDTVQLAPPSSREGISAKDGLTLPEIDTKRRTFMVTGNPRQNRDASSTATATRKGAPRDPGLQILGETRGNKTRQQRPEPAVSTYHARLMYGKNLERNWIKQQLLEKEKVKRNARRAERIKLMLEMMNKTGTGAAAMTSRRADGADTAANQPAPGRADDDQSEALSLMNHADDDMAVRGNEADDVFDVEEDLMTYKSLNPARASMPRTKLLRYASTDVLVSEAEDLSPSSPSDIELVLDGDQLVERKSKHKMRRKRQEDDHAFSRLCSDDDSGADRLHEIISPLAAMTDKELRALRLNLNKAKKKRQKRQSFRHVAKAVLAAVKFMGGRWQKPAPANNKTTPRNRANKAKTQAKTTPGKNASHSANESIKRVRWDNTVRKLSDHYSKFQRFTPDGGSTRDRFMREFGHMTIPIIIPVIECVQTGEDNSEILQASSSATSSKGFAAFIQSEDDLLETLKQIPLYSYPASLNTVVEHGNNTRYGNPLVYLTASGEYVARPHRLASRRFSDPGRSPDRSIHIRQKKTKPNKRSKKKQKQSGKTSTAASKRPQQKTGMSGNQLTVPRAAPSPDARTDKPHQSRPKSRSQSQLSTARQRSFSDLRNSATSIRVRSRANSRASAVSVKSAESDTELITIKAEVRKRPQSARTPHRRETEIDIRDLAQDAQVAAKDVKIQILERRRKRQRKRMMEKLKLKELAVKVMEAERARKEADENEAKNQSELSNESESEVKSDEVRMRYLQSSAACSGVAWNLTKTRPRVVTEDEVEAAIPRLSRLFLEMRHCNYIRWTKRDAMIIQRLQEIEDGSY